MRLNNLSVGKRKFDMSIKPWKRPWFLLIVELFLYFVYKFILKFKVIKHNMEGLKGPYIVLQNHASFIDFVLTIKAIGFKSCAWVTSVEEFVGREWLMRSVGCTPKRKFTPDVKVPKNILHALRKNNQIVTVFPEARFVFAGINEEIDPNSYARLIKIAKVPVVIGISKGNFVSSPQWCKHPFKRIPIIGEFTQIITKEQVESLSIDEIRDILVKNFVYDDYKYWQDSGLEIKSKYRAQGIHKVLYQCPSCKKEFEMNSYGNTIECNCCKKNWTITPNGKVKASVGVTEFENVPDWYRWERSEVRKQVDEGTYHIEDDVRVESLRSSTPGFVKEGVCKLTHDENGFTLLGKLDNGEDLYLNRPVESMYSCHVEFDFKKRGDAIDLVPQDGDMSYFVFPLNLKNRLTKIHLATEELYKKKMNI